MSFFNLMDILVTELEVPILNTCNYYLHVFQILNCAINCN